MTIATLDELQTNLLTYLKIVQDGETVFIKIKDEVIAELKPVLKLKWETAKQEADRIRKRISKQKFSDSTEIIREDRDR